MEYFFLVSFLESTGENKVRGLALPRLHVAEEAFLPQSCQQLPLVTTCQLQGHLCQALTYGFLFEAPPPP